MQEYSVKIDQVDLSLERQEQVFTDEMLRRLDADKFSMTGGLYVFFSVISGGEVFIPGSALVARRIEPIKEEPNSFAQASLPEFMEYRAYGGAGTTGWAVDFANALIAANYGKLPGGWLELAMERTEALGSEQ